MKCFKDAIRLYTSIFDPYQARGGWKSLFLHSETIKNICFVVCLHFIVSLTAL